MQKKANAKRILVAHKQVLETVNSIPINRSSQRDTMFRILEILYRKSFQDSQVPGTFIPIPCEYWKKAVAEHYERGLKPLIEYGVIQSTESYSNFEGNKQCKSYRINPNLMDDDVEAVSYSFRTNDTNSNRIDDSVAAKHTRKMLRKVKIDSHAAKTRTMLYALQNEFAGKLQFDNNVYANGGIEVDCSRILSWKDDKMDVTKDRAIEIASKYGCSLIKDKNKYLIDYAWRYCKHKRSHIIQAYCYAISRMKDKIVYANRNSTNLRLDSNITSFPNILLPYMTFEGKQFVSVDLRNSQMVILASLVQSGFFDEYIKDFDNNEKLNEVQSENKTDTDNQESFIFTSLITEIYRGIPYHTFIKSIYLYRGTIISEDNIKTNKDTVTVKEGVTYMCAKSPILEMYYERIKNSYSIEKTDFPEDLNRFMILAKNGKIYEYIQAELGLPNRDIAKILMFEIFFSKHTFHGGAKPQIRKLFPTLVRMIDKFKKAKGDNEFAITLQKRESLIFIDQIMLRLITRGYKVLSKHDSILCLPGDLYGVVSEIKAVLDKTLGKHELKITDAYDKPISLLD